MTEVKQAKLICADYFGVHSGKCSLPRSGFFLVGIHDEEKITVPNRPDTVGEHSDGVEHLVGMIAMLRPDLIPPEMLGRALRVMRYHDAPEIESGDIPDDGNRDEKRKDLDEYKVLQRMTADWPEIPKLETRLDFLDFQHRDSALGQVLYCTDKIEAVLRLLEYERRGVIGDITAKPRMSVQDEENRRACGTNNPSDVWCRHALNSIYGCMGFSLAYEIVREAFRLVRGEVPAWLSQWYAERTTLPPVAK